MKTQDTAQAENRILVETYLRSLNEKMIAPRHKELSGAIVAMTSAIESLDRRLAAIESAGAAEALAKAAATLVTFERRMSRHAEHLARLENRLKAGGL
jgi:CCR4-NOT transcriptional regulation complex NOT5 subunit